MDTELRWQKSSFSGGAEGNECVEVAATPGMIHLRESDTPTTHLTTTPTPSPTSSRQYTQAPSTPITERETQVTPSPVTFPGPRSVRAV